MALKKVAWFGPFALKQLGGIPPFKAKVVDARVINWETLKAYQPWLAVTDNNTRILEFCGENVDLHAMDRLLSPIIPAPEITEPVIEIVPEPPKVIVPAPVVKAPKPKAPKVIDPMPKPTHTDLMIAPEEVEKIDMSLAPDPAEPTIVEDAPKKRGRKKKSGEDFKFNF